MPRMDNGARRLLPDQRDRLFPYCALEHPLYTTIIATTIPPARVIQSAHTITRPRRARPRCRGSPAGQPDRQRPALTPARVRTAARRQSWHSARRHTTSSSSPVATSKTNPRSEWCSVTNGLASIRRSDCRTSCSRSSNDSADHAGLMPTSSWIARARVRCEAHMRVTGRTVA